MNNPELPLKPEANRLDPRVIPQGITVAIRRRGLFTLPRFQPCQFLSISRGGIGILVDDWSVPTNSKVTLKLNYHGNEFVANGIIAHRSYQEDFYKYGVIFTSVSYELDRLIDFFLQQLPKDYWDTEEQGRQRQLRKSPRFQLKELYAGIQVPVLFGRKNIHKCQVNDISSTGISFCSPVSLSSKMPFKARVELAVNSEPYRADGLVNHYRITEHGYCYGLQFINVTPGLSQAIEGLLATNSQVSSIILN